MNSIPRWLIVAFGFAILALIAGGTWFYRVQQQLVREQADSRLQAVAELKTNQITDWRSSLLRRAALIMESPFFVQAVRQWIADPQTELAEKFVTRFRSIREHYQCLDVMLVDTKGHVRLSLSNRVVSLHEMAMRGLETALQERRPVLTDLHSGPSDLPSHVDVVAPFFEKAKSGGVAVGALVFQFDARQSVYPLVQAPARPTRTAETLLVRREGDSVLFLNDSRHHPGAALTFQIPLTQKDEPEVQAVLGRTGVVQGKDYRGIEVLAAIKAIPNSPWFLIAKIDREEALSGSTSRSFLVIGLVLAMMTSLVAIAGVIWQRDAKANYRKLYEAELAQHASEEKFRVIAETISEVFWMADVRSGAILYVSPSYEKVWGRSVTSLYQNPKSFIESIHKEDRERVIPDLALQKKGRPFDLEYRIIKPDGEIRWIWDHGFPIVDETGKATYSVGASRDITDRKNAMEELRKARDELEDRVRERTSELLETANRLSSEIELRRRVEHELERAKERLEILFESIGESVFLLDAHGSILACNNSAAVRLGKSKHEIIDSVVFDLVPGDTAALLRAMFDRVVRTGEPEQYEEEISERWYSSRLYPVRSIDGQVIGLSLISLDITEKKLMLRELDRKEEQYRTVADFTYGWEYWRTPDGQFAYVSPSCERMTGYTAREFLEDPELIAKIIHPDDRPRFRCCAEMINDPQSAVFETMEFRIIRKDGEERWIGHCCQRVVGTEGQYLGRRGSNRDVTDRKISEESLRESENRFRSIFENSLDGIILSSPEGEVFNANPATCRMFGMTEQEIRAMGRDALVDSEDPRWREFLEERKRVGGLRGELSMRRKGGTIFPVSISTTIFETAHGEDRTTLMIRDITERKQAEEALKQKTDALQISNKDLEQFAYVAAHDLRQPLIGVAAYLKLLERRIGKSLESEAQKYLTKSLDTVMKMDFLITSLLDYSRVSERKRDPEPTDAGACLSQALANLNTVIKESRATVTTDVLPMVMGIPTQITQVLQNLIANAIKFRGSEPLQIHVGTAGGESEHEFWVRDNGIGIEPPYFDRIFQLFQRIEKSGGPEGTGIGLATCKKIIERHGGRIWVESEPGKGSIFRFTLPAIDSEAKNQV